MQTGDAARALPKLQSKEVDIAVAALPDHQPEGINFITLAQTPLVFILPKNSPEIITYSRAPSIGRRPRSSSPPRGWGEYAGKSGLPTRACAPIFMPRYPATRQSSPWSAWAAASASSRNWCWRKAVSRMRCNCEPQAAADSVHGGYLHPGKKSAQSDSSLLLGDRRGGGRSHSHEPCKDPTAYQRRRHS
jgi:hypothetical protein